MRPEALNTLGLQSQVAVSCFTWVLETEVGSSRRAWNALNPEPSLKSYLSSVSNTEF